MLRGNGIEESFISAAILDVREIIQSFFFFFYPPRPYLKVHSSVFSFFLPVRSVVMRTMIH